MHNHHTISVEQNIAHEKYNSHNNHQNDCEIFCDLLMNSCLSGMNLIKYDELPNHYVNTQKFRPDLHNDLYSIHLTKEIKPPISA